MVETQERQGLSLKEVKSREGAYNMEASQTSFPSSKCNLNMYISIYDECISKNDAGAF